MTSKQLFYSLAGTLLLGSIVITPFLVDTNAQSNIQVKTSEKNSQFRRKQNNKDVFEAVQNKDYNAWAEAVAQTQRGDVMLEKINQDTFPVFIEMVEAYKNQDTDAGDALAGELDIPTKAERQAFGSSMREVFKNADYNSYLDLVTNAEDFPEDAILTVEEFNQKAEYIANREERRHVRRGKHQALVTPE